MTRRLVWFGLLGALVLVGGVGWWLGSSSQSPDQAAAKAEEPPASWETAVVEERALQSTVIERGDVAPEQSLGVGIPTSIKGTAVVTQVLVTAGDQPVEGDRIAEISGRPVFLMAGDVPVYRSLEPTMSGADVKQLQEALTRLGYTPETDGIFGEKTKEAVTALYEKAGYEPIETSETAEVDIAQAEESVTQAESQVLEAKRGTGGEGQSSATAAQIALNQAKRAAQNARAEQTAQLALAQNEYDAKVRELERVMAEPETPATEPEAPEPDPKTPTSDPETPEPDPADFKSAREQAAMDVEHAKAKIDETRRSTDEAVTQADEEVKVKQAELNDALKSDADGASKRSLAIAEEAVVQAKKVLDTTRAKAGPKVPQGEVVFVPSFPARVLSAQAAVGSVGGAASDDGGGGGEGLSDGGGEGAPAAGGGGSVVELAVGRLVVTTKVRPDTVGLLHDGLEVELLDETTSATYPAKISELADEPEAGADGQLAYPAVLVPDEPLPDSLTGANLRITATTASTEGEVLVVPVAAVSSSANGATRVTVVDGPNDETPVDVEVTAGLSADGFVAVEPVQAGSLTADDLVVVGQ